MLCSSISSDLRPALQELYRQFKPEDMLGTEEHMEGAPFQPPAIARLVSCLYMCIEGRCSGVFVSQ